MVTVEKQVILHDNINSLICPRKVNDKFVLARDKEHLQQLKTSLQENSNLIFTYEFGNNKLPILHVLIRTTGNKYRTFVYLKKPTLKSALIKIANVRRSTKCVSSTISCIEHTASHNNGYNSMQK